ncbi:MAG: hypothetical protein OEM38_10425 [Gammaproteobacteria bacterium]|nr:hypothetical protein [Gammaproteobacteria bacterium]
MKYFEEDPYNDSMTDAEFFKLMGVENMVAASQKYNIEKEKNIPLAQVQQSTNSILKTLLPAAIVVMLAALLV